MESILAVVIGIAGMWFIVAWMEIMALRREVDSQKDKIKRLENHVDGLLDIAESWVREMEWQGEEKIPEQESEPDDDLGFIDGDDWKGR